MNLRIHTTILFLTAACWVFPTAELLILQIFPPSSADAESASTFTVSASGYITDNSHDLARVNIKGNEAKAIISFPLPTDASRTVKIALPSSSRLAADAISFQSVQGTVGMAWTQLEPGLIQIELPSLLAEAHTSATIRLQVSELRPSLLVRLLSVLDTYPLGFSLLSLALPLIFLLALLLTLKLPRDRNPSTELEKPPDGLTASELGTLWHGGILSQDISALFLSMAERGKFEIILHSQQILLVRRGIMTVDQAEVTSFMELLFPGGSRITYLELEVQQLRQEIYSSRVGVLYAAAYGKLCSSGYYLESPQRTHLRIKTIGILLQLMGVFGAAYSFFQLTNERFSTFFLLSLIQYGVGVLLYQISSRSSLLSAVGQNLFREVSGFISYLSSEKSISSDTTNDSFFRYFPYAVAVGCTANWLNRFRNSSQTIPSWLSVENEELHGGERFTDHAMFVADLLSLTLRKLKDPNVG